MKNPKVTVLMSVFNGEKFLRESIDSILEQTYENFEFLIIDDGSIDYSAEIIKSYKDSRIRFEPNINNIGLTASLNKGLKLSQGKYIARMDCDDTSFPERLERQVEFLDNNSNVGVCGTGFIIFTKSGEDEFHFPTEHNDIVCNLFFYNVIAHPSVMLNLEFFNKFELYYDESYRTSQDYELWVRAGKYIELANLFDVLVRIRYHDEQLRQSAAVFQEETANKIRLIQLDRLGLELDEYEWDLHYDLCMNKLEMPKNFFSKTVEWIHYLSQRNEKISAFPEPEFSKVLAEKLYNLCQANTKYGSDIFFAFYNSHLHKYKSTKVRENFKFLKKSLFKKSK